MKLKTGIVIRNIAGECIAIPTGPAASSVNGLIALTPSGEVLLRRLQTECEIEALVDALLEKYDVSPEQARADVLAFVEKLKGVNLL